MLLTEYDVKKHMKLERIEAREEGIEIGREEGIEIGREEGIEIGIDKGMEGTVRICQKLNLSKEEMINYIKEEYDINEEEAENIVNKYWTDRKSVV